jgi:dCMP deaminase
MTEQISRIDQLNDVIKTIDPRLNWDEYFMSLAALVSARSPCSRLHTGCVIVSGEPTPNRVISTGYNGFLPGAAHNSHIVDTGDGKHEMATVHAEQNAIADAARRGARVEGATAYTLNFPCINCTKVMVAAGIKVIKYHFDYNNGLHMNELVLDLLKDAGVRIEKI